MRHAVAAALDIAGCSGLFDIVNLGAAFGVLIGIPHW